MNVYNPLRDNGVGRSPVSSSERKPSPLPFSVTLSIIRETLSNDYSKQACTRREQREKIKDKQSNANVIEFQVAPGPKSTKSSNTIIPAQNGIPTIYYTVLFL